MSETAFSRTELMKAALGTAFASGITEVQTLDIDESVVALVLKLPGSLTQEAHQNVLGAFERIFHGTPLVNARVIILEEGMSLEALRLPKVGG